jgi:hypothetical protein
MTDQGLVRPLIHCQPLEPERIGRHFREATRLSAIIAKIRVRQIVKLCRAFFPRGQDHQAIGVLYRKQPQEQGVHDAENSRVRPNPDRQSRDCNGREARTLAEISGGVAKVLPEGFERGQTERILPA